MLVVHDGGSLAGNDAAISSSTSLSEFKSPAAIDADHETFEASWRVSPIVGSRWSGMDVSFWGQEASHLEPAFLRGIRRRAWTHSFTL